jgi:hypothetical protein
MVDWGLGLEGVRLRVKVGYSGVIAFWQGDEFVACAFDDGEGDEVSRHLFARCALVSQLVHYNATKAVFAGRGRDVLVDDILE